MYSSSSYMQWLTCAIYTAVSLSKSTSKCDVYNCSLKADKLVIRYQKVFSKKKKKRSQNAALHRWSKHSQLLDNNKALSFILHLSTLHSLT